MLLDKLERNQLLLKMFQFRDSTTTKRLMMFTLVSRRTCMLLGRKWIIGLWVWLRKFSTAILPIQTTKNWSAENLSYICVRIASLCKVNASLHYVYVLLIFYTNRRFGSSSCIAIYFIGHVARSFACYNSLRSLDRRYKIALYEAWCNIKYFL